MAPPVTELANLPLKPGANPEDPNTDEGKIFHEGLRILSQQPGYQRSYYGRQVEDETVLRWFIDWDDKAAHMTFVDSDAYPPFLKLFGGLLAGPPILFHAAFDPFPPKSACNAPATEVLFMYYPTSISTAEMDAHASNCKKIAEAFAGIEGSLPMTGGWVLEELPNDKVEGGKARVFVGLLGWTSVEAHMAGRESQVFKDNIHYLSDAVAMSDREMFHVKLKEY